MMFRELLSRAKVGDCLAIEMLLDQYKPLLVKESIVDGMFDEDLYQELCITMFRCLKKFRL